MTPVRIGLAGYGRGGRFFHAPLIGLAPECTLAAAEPGPFGTLSFGTVPEGR
jgi:hypothetical protein